MGIMTPSKDTNDCDNNIPPLPWLSTSHPLQNHVVIHASLRTAFCGSLTTFASWNTQMVIMMVGAGNSRNTHTHTQIVSAILGYILGLLSSIASFLFGRYTAIWLHYNIHKNNTNTTNSINDFENTIHNRMEQEHSFDSITSTNDNNYDNCEHHASLTDSTSHNLPQQYPSIQTQTTGNTTTSTIRNKASLSSYLQSIFQFIINILDIIFHRYYSPFLISTILLILYFIADYALHIPFYKTMWVTSLSSPPGTILRWKLSSWFNDNPPSLLLSCTQHHCRRRDDWKWIPFGTLFANIIASLISITCSGIRTHFSISYNSHLIVFLLLSAIQTGFAGNLSTVSTFVKEIVQLAQLYQYSSE